MSRLANTFLILGLAVTAAGPANASNLVTDGDFASGGLSNWAVTPFSYDPYGYSTTSESSTPVVSSVDLGNGPQNAVSVQVGLASGQPSSEGGVSFNQVFSTTGGMLDFSALVGAYSQYGTGDGGSFEVDLDGQYVDSFSFQHVDGLSTQTLATSFLASAGEHNLSIDVYRQSFNLFLGSAPTDYLTNIALLGDVAVPEPGTAMLTLAGLGLIGFLRGTGRLRSSAAR